MRPPLRLLHLEDDFNDAGLIAADLQNGGVDCVITLVSSRADFVARLAEGNVDLILSDYSLPGFDGMAALQLTREKWPILPFVLVSGTLGEEVAVEALKSGATDYVLKDRLSRLVPVVRRAMADVERQEEARRATADLLRKTALLEAQVNSTIDGILVVDERGRKVLQNDRLLEMWGIPPEIAAEEQDDSSLEFVLKQVADPEGFAKRIRSLYASPQTVSREEIERKDGTVYDRYTSPVRDKQGRHYGRIWVFRDITEQKQAEMQLRKLSLAMEQSPASVVITDLQGRIEYVNPKFTEVTGYTLAEALGQNPRLLKSGRQAAAEYAEMWREITSGRTWRGEFNNRRKNGELYWERATISPITSQREGITHFLAIKEDITEYRQMEAQFRQAQKMEAVGRLAAGVAHDFNNMLTVILGYSDILLEELPADGADGEALGEIKKAAERAARLTRQLLAFSRQQMLEPQDLDLHEVVAECGRMLRRLVGEDIILEVTLEPGAKLVRADPGQLEQALINLVVNARDAIGEFGKITVETAHVVLDDAFCRVHPEARPGPCVVLLVGDTGCGMDEETLTRIFEPFFTTKAPGKGTGLGLAMVFGFIKQSGGCVTVKSVPGTGTTFRVYLPALTAEDKPVAVPPEVLTGGGETILVAEDENGVRQLSRSVLAARGYTVLEAGRGDAALQLAASHPGPIHLLLADVVMPGMGGGHLADEIKRLRPDIKVLLVSGYSGDALDRHGGQLEGRAFLQKPFSVGALVQKVRAVLDDQSGS